MARPILPIEDELKLKDIEKRIQELTISDVNASIAYQQLMGIDGQPIYTPEEADEEVRKIRGTSYSAGYGTPDELKSSFDAPASNVIPKPGRPVTERLAEGLSKRSVVPESRPLQSSYVIDFDAYKNDLVENKQVPIEEADNFITGLKAVYEYKLNQGIDQEKALQEADEEVGNINNSKKIQLKNDEASYKKQIRSTKENAPDYTPSQMQYYKAIKEKEEYKRANYYLNDVFGNTEYDQTTISIPDKGEFTIPTDILIYIDENKAFNKDLLGYAFEEDIRKSNYEMINDENQFGQVIASESSKIPLYYQKGMARVLAQKDIQNRPKDTWYLSDEYKEAVISNPEKFIEEGFFHDTFIDGGTIENNLEYFFRQIGAVGSAAMEGAAPILTPSIAIASEYIAEPLSYGIQNVIIDSIPLGKDLLDRPEPLEERKSLNYLLEAEQRRQQSLRETTPQYAANDFFGRIGAGYSRGTTIFEISIESIKDEGYDSLTKTLIGAPAIVADVLNPLDPIAWKSVGIVADSVKLNKIDKQFNNGGISNISSTAIKQLSAEAQREPVVKAIMKSIDPVKRKILESGDPIIVGDDIRFQAGSKIRDEIEASDHYLELGSQVSFEDVMQNIALNFPKTALAKQLEKAENYFDAEGIYLKHQNLLYNNAAMPSLKTYKNQTQLQRNLRVGESAEEALYNIKNAPDYKNQVKANKTLNKDLNSALKTIRRTLGHNKKLTAEDIVFIQKVLQQRTSLEAVADLFPKGLGSLRHVRRLTDSVYVDKSVFKKVEDLVYETDIMKTLYALKLNPKNIEVLTQTSRMVEADYLKGQFQRNSDWTKMIYYNATRDTDNTAITLSNLSIADKNKFLKEVSKLPLKVGERKRILTDIRNNSLFLKDERRIVDMLLETTARRLQVDLPVDMLTRLSKGEQKTLQKAVGSPGRATISSSPMLQDSRRLITSQEEMANIQKGNVERAVNYIKNKFSNETKIELDEQIKIFPVDSDILPAMQQKMLQALRNSITAAKSKLDDRLKDVKNNFNAYGLTDKPSNDYEAFSAYIRGKTQNSYYGKLAQRSDIAGMFEVCIDSLLGTYKEELNYGYLDKFFETKIIKDRAVYTIQGESQLRLKAEDMARELIENPTKFEDVLLKGAQDWLDIIRNKGLIDRETGEFVAVLNARAIPSQIGFSSSIKVLREGILNEQMRGYLVQEVFKTQSEAIHDIALPLLDEVNLKALAPTIRVNRPQYTESVKSLLTKMQANDYNRRRDFETARGLLNNAMAETRISDNPNLRELLETFTDDVSSYLIEGYNDTFKATTKFIKNRANENIKLTNKKFKLQTKNVKEQAASLIEPYKGQRTTEAKMFRKRVNRNLQQALKNISAIKIRDLNSIKNKTRIDLDKQEEYLSTILTKIDETNDESSLIELYNIAKSEDVITADKRFDSFIEIKNTISIPPNVYDENVYNMVQYAEDVARKNDLFERANTTVKDLQTNIDEIFGTSNRLGQAFFGKEDYDRFFKMYQAHGLAQISDVYNLLKKDGLSKDFWSMFKSYISWWKGTAYTVLLSIRTRFQGTNALTQSFLEMGTTGRISKPGDVLKGYRGVFAGRTDQSPLYYKIAVTDRFGRSYTYGEIYNAIESTGTATDMSFTRSLGENKRLIRQFNNSKSNDEGISKANLSKMYSTSADAVTSFTSFPIQADLAHRYANIINAIRDGQNFTDAVEAGKQSLLNYTALSPTEQKLQHYTMFYTFTRQITVNAFETLFNADSMRNTLRVIRLKKDMGMMQRMHNEGRQYPYMITMPNYMQVRAGYEAYKKENSEKDVYLFTPAVPQLEGFSTIVNVLNMPFDKEAREDLYEQAARLINPFYSGFFKEPNRAKRVPPEIVGTLSYMYTDHEALQEAINFIAGDKVIPVFDPSSIYAVNGYVWNLQKRQQKTFWHNVGLFNYTIRSTFDEPPEILTTVSSIIDPTSFLFTAFRDYYRILNGEGTPYASLNNYERVLSTIGAVTPMNVTKPEVIDLKQTLRRLQELKQPITEQKKQTEGLTDPR